VSLFEKSIQGDAAPPHPERGRVGEGVDSAGRSNRNTGTKLVTPPGSLLSPTSTFQGEVKRRRDQGDVRVSHGNAAQLSVSMDIPTSVPTGHRDIA
jgi:hypothetical protein